MSESIDEDWSLWNAWYGLEQLGRIEACRESIAKGLRVARENAGIGLRELARRIDADPSNYSKFEKGKLWSERYAKAAYETLSALD